MSLIKPVLFMLSQVKMSTVKKTQHTEKLWEPLTEIKEDPG